MEFVAAKCPQCGGELQLDPMIETGFCMHCGSKIIVQEAIRSVRIDNTQMVSTWMIMGDRATEAGNHQEAYEYYTKICEVQPNNWWALFKKGKAAGWQSTLQNVRYTEAAICFADAYKLSPENEKREIEIEAAEEIKKMGLALISVRADSFIKLPEENNANGLLVDLQNIKNAIKQLSNKDGMEVVGIMEPLAYAIISAVVVAWNNKIKPDYIGASGHPGQSQFDQYVARIGYCTMLTANAINLSDKDYLVDIKGYENLIALHNEAINGCSWYYQDSAYGREYHKRFQLSDSAKKARRDIIAQCKVKINETKIRKEQSEKAEELKKMQLAKEEAIKRSDEYWSDHPEEKAQLESEKIELTEQVKEGEKEKDIVMSPFIIENEKIIARIAKLHNEQKNLGLFKGNEKKALQAQMANAQNDLDLNTSKKKEAIKIIEVNIENLKKRLSKIDDELTKAR
jgi:hypothetical protein